MEISPVEAGVPPLGGGAVLRLFVWLGFSGIRLIYRDTNIKFIASFGRGADLEGLCR